MGGRKRQYIEELLLSAAQKRHPVRVLEWGSGGSTVYFTRWLVRRGIPFEWVSLEYDPVWYEKVQRELGNDTSVSLVLFDTKGRDPRRQDVPMNEYVKYPKALGTTFDLIIVDGRKRRRCVLQAKEILREGGVVLLDDAFRPRYWPALKGYSHSRFCFDSLWIGSLVTPGFSLRIINLLNRSAYRCWFSMKWLWKRLRANLRQVVRKE